MKFYDTIVDYFINYKKRKNRRQIINYFQKNITTLWKKSLKECNMKEEMIVMKTNDEKSVGELSQRIMFNFLVPHIYSIEDMKKALKNLNERFKGNTRIIFNQNCSENDGTYFHFVLVVINPEKEVMGSLEIF